MKKYILILIAVMICGTGYAQKGRHAVGVNTSLFRIVTPHPKGLGGRRGLFTGLKYQYGISNTFRLEGQFALELFDGACMDGSVNLHTFFINEGRFRPYLITGFSVNNHITYSIYYSYKDWDYEDGVGVGARLGLGLNTRLSYNWDLQVEACYHTTFAEFISLGVTYNF